MSALATDTHHGPSYLTIFLALVVLTAATVGVYYVDLGQPAGVIVAMAIASCKATLVALYFMHLRFEVRPLYIVVGVPLVLTAILILALVPDIGRG
jgi:cytochrome c oxidase subunit 4